MVRYIIIAAFSVLFLWGCGSSDDNEVSNTGGSWGYDDFINNDYSGSSDEDTPSDDSAATPEGIKGLTVLPTGATAVPLYDGSSYYSLLYYIPNDVSDSNESRYNVSTKGVSSPVEALKLLPVNHQEPTRGSYSYFRAREAELLASGFPQARPKLRKGATSYKVGDIWKDVYISRNVSDDSQLVDAECIGVSEHAYFFLEKGLQKPSQSGLDAIINGFEGIYPIMHEKFGVENDVDGNGKVIIMLFRFNIKEVFGYFDGNDKFSKANVAVSNEADIFYVNDIYMETNFNDLMATLAHEFQHMIHFDNRYNKGFDSLDLWIDEGLAMQAEYFTGYFDNSEYDYAGAFLERYAEISLTNWDYVTMSNYTSSCVFVRYLVEQFGDDVIKRLYNSSKTGTDAVAEAAGKPFNDIFEDFVLALFLSGKGVTDDSRYNFKTIDIQGKGGLKVFHRAEVGRSIDSPILPYSMQLVEWSGELSELTLSSNIKGFGLPKKQ